MRTAYVLGDVAARGTGGHTRIASTVRALARVSEVELLYPARPGHDLDPALEELEGVSAETVHGRRRVARAASAARQLARGRPPQVARSVKPALVRELAARLRERPPDVVIADQLSAAVTCLDAGATEGDARSIYNGHNLEWPLRAASGSGTRLAWAGVRRLERSVLREFDQSWMVSEADRRGALALCPGADVKVVPNAVEVSAIQPVTAPAADPVVLFVGSFDYAPNREALRWLAGEVMPRVWARRADARVRAVGRWPGRAWEPPDDRVEVVGFVHELRDAYAAARCCVAPLLVGGGTPLKVVEALAYGLPLVATPVAVRSLDGLDGGSGVRVADGAAAFADALIELLEPGYDHGDDAARGRRVVERSYSVDAIAEVVAAALTG